MDFETKLESEAGSISDCEKKGDFPVGNISENNGLKPEVGSLPDFKRKEDLDFDTKLESEAGSLETMERKKNASCQKRRLVQNLKEVKSGM